MGLIAPWDVYYFNNYLESPYFHYQNFSSKTKSLILEFLKTFPGIKSMVLRAPWFVSFSKNCLEPPKFHYQRFSFEISFKPVNQLIIISVTKKMSPLPLPSTYLCWKKIHMSSLYKSHRQFVITPKNKFQYQ